MVESSPLHARMRLAQRRAMAVMPAYIRSMARRRACQASEVRASAIGKERHSLGSSPQRRKACRAMTQRKRLSQPACQAVSQTTPSGLGDLLLSFGRKQRTAMARTPSAMCSLRQAGTSQMSQSGVRCLAFMRGSIAAVRGVGETGLKSTSCFFARPLKSLAKFFAAAVSIRPVSSGFVRDLEAEEVPACTGNAAEGVERLPAGDGCSASRAAPRLSLC